MMYEGQKATSPYLGKCIRCSGLIRDGEMYCAECFWKNERGEKTDV